MQRPAFIDDERVVFNVGGNKFRLVVKVWFPGRAVLIKFVEPTQAMTRSM